MKLLWPNGLITDATETVGKMIVAKKQAVEVWDAPEIPVSVAEPEVKKEVVR